jgi:shikimate dehydrogenase
VKNIVLIGLPGSGKTTLGRRAALALGLDFVDMDEVLARRAGMTIPEIFAAEGEKGFRNRESALCAEWAGAARRVIATGGGAVLRAENVAALRRNGFVVFVDRPPTEITGDVDTGGRPLLSGGADRVYALSAQRRSLYLAAADAGLPNEAGPEEALAGLLALARFVYPPSDGFAVIGDPIGHTLSPPLHRAVFAALGVDAPYEAIRVPRGRMGDFAAAVRGSGLGGFNVTIPHKRDILPFLDEVDGDAALCGAVNTVTVRDGRLYGYNTDMGGLLQALRSRGYGYRGRAVVLLGAGGAAAGAALKAALEGAARVTVLARRTAAAETLAAQVRRAVPGAVCDGGAMDGAGLRRAAGDAEILINATPLGMRGGPDGFPSLDFLRAAPPGALVCDLIYNPPRTALLAKAEGLGLAVMNGLDMLIHQALLADELFLGRTLDRAGLFQMFSNKGVKLL